jgi:hypothetical protein
MHGSTPNVLVTAIASAREVLQHAANQRFGRRVTVVEFGERTVVGLRVGREKIGKKRQKQILNNKHNN